MSAPHCVACGQSESRPLHCVNGFSTVRCTGCGLARTELPEGFDPASIYTEEYFQGGQSDGYADYQGSRSVLAAEFSQLVEALRRDSTKPGRLLELGCAYGYFLEEAQRHYTVLGVEVSEAARADCIRRGLPVVPELSVEVAASHGPFDVAVMLDVIEHLEDPESVLRKVRASLNPSGRLLLTTGDIDSAFARCSGRRWRLMTPPQHLWFFSPTTIRKLLARTGFRVVRIDHPGKRVPLSLIGYQAIRACGLRAPRWIRKLPGSVPVNLFDAMRVVAEAE